MTTALAKVDFFDEEQIGLIKTELFPKITPNELKLFTNTAQRLGLDPFARQIFAVHRYDKRVGRDVMSIQTAIDGFRLIAERTKEYEGQIGPHWCSASEETKWRDVWVSKSPPFAARVGVWRKGFREPIYAVARLAAYQQTVKGGGINHMWAKMGDLMIAKCAEALALRRAFPASLSGVYTTDEMGQVDNEPMTIAARKPTKREDETKPGTRGPVSVDFPIAPAAPPKVPTEKEIALTDIKRLLVKHSKSQLEKKDTLEYFFGTRVWKKVEALPAKELLDGLIDLHEALTEPMPDWDISKELTPGDIEDAAKGIT